MRCMVTYGSSENLHMDLAAHMITGTLGGTVFGIYVGPVEARQPAVTDTGNPRAIAT